MDSVIGEYLQNCIDICRRLEEELNEHKEKTALAVSGEVFEEYEGFILRTNELRESLQKELIKLHNIKTVM